MHSVMLEVRENANCSCLFVLLRKCGATPDEVFLKILGARLRKAHNWLIQNICPSVYLVLLRDNLKYKNHNKFLLEQLQLSF